MKIEEPEVIDEFVIGLLESWNSYDFDTIPLDKQVVCIWKNSLTNKWQSDKFYGWECYKRPTCRDLNKLPDWGQQMIWWIFYNPLEEQKARSASMALAGAVPAVF